MSKRGLEHLKNRIQNRIEELEQELFSLNMKDFWDDYDTFSHFSMYREMTDLRAELVKLK